MLSSDLDVVVRIGGGTDNSILSELGVELVD